MITIFDALLFFAGIGLVYFGEYLVLLGGAESNLGIAIFAVVVVTLGLFLTFVRELTTENADVEAQFVRGIYGTIVLVTGLIFVLFTLYQAYTNIVSNNFPLGRGLLASLSILIGIILIFLGLAWNGAFDGRGLDE